ncbi:DMT family transporter [Saccharothrix syringae]|uniref:DMT family transporter n=1 Tax=Saccharothrix syringae TaxID=103733 RepID=A0A5Q0H2M1_SACSY|nr:DMT family transporter [Saccharothrix syringae]QFZ19942.1 DMT family transporter [Saccharothrix syringae]
MTGRGVLRVGLLALLWGSCFLWIELALTGFAPAQIATARCALGAAFVFALARRAGQRLPRGLWGHLAVAALFCNALPFVLFGIGQQTVDSGVAGVLNATTPLWSLLIGLVTGGERGLSPVRAAGLGLGFAGVLVVFAPWEQGVTGVGALFLLAAAAGYAVAFAYMSRTLVAKGAPLAVSAAQLAVAAGLSALLLPFDGAAAGPNTVAVVALVVLGVLGTGATFVLNYRIITDEGPTNAAAVGYLLPVVSVALGAVVLGEPLTPRVVVGVLVVVAGVALTRLTAAPGASGVGRRAAGAVSASVRG